MEVTRTLARWLVSADPRDVPKDAKREGVRSLVNWLGCAVGAARHEAVECALAALLPFAGPPQASVLGRSEKTDILNAALMNGITSHVFDFDDTHLPTIIHPSGPVASALFALAEYRPVSGAELLHAFILGVEAECRIGNAVYPDHYDRGWHITGTAGVFGAAAGAGRILGLNEQQMTWALGIAGTQSSGFREMFGTHCKSFHPGRAAQNGLMSALLAARNFTSSNQVLEAPRGFAHVMSTKQDFARITDGLGRSYEVTLNSYKPFACGIVIHPAIDACVQLKREYQLTGDEVERVELAVAPLMLELTGKRKPQTGLEGKFSVFHSTAAALLFGAAGEKQYSDACVRNARVVSLRDRVAATVDPKKRDDEVDARVILKDGRVLTKHIDHAIGSRERPMTDDNLSGKFRGLVDDILGEAQSARLLDAVWSLELLSDAAGICRLATPEAAAERLPRGRDLMAEIIAGFASSHSVMLAATREDWIANFRKTDPGMPLFDRHGTRRSYGDLLALAPANAADLVTAGRMGDAYDRTVAAVNALKQQIENVPLDALIVIGDDQHELFQDAMMPSLAIYYGTTIRNAARPQSEPENWYARAQSNRYEPGADAYYPVASELALHLIEALSAAEFDICAVKEIAPGQHEGHAFSYIHRTYLSGRTLPVVPVFINTYYAPNPITPKRCVALGKALHGTIAGFPGEMRVGVLASGGLSHFIVDEELDRGVLRALEEQDLEYLACLDPKRLQAGSIRDQRVDLHRRHMLGGGPATEMDKLYSSLAYAGTNRYRVGICALGKD